MTRPVNAEIIARTEDTDDPVCEIKLEDSGSFIHTIVDHQEECIRIMMVESRVKGDMSRLLDTWVKQFEYDEVRFMNPLDELKTGEKLIDKLDGFEKMTEEISEEMKKDTGHDKVEAYVGEWEVET
jgi:hypothetical protein